MEPGATGFDVVRFLAPMHIVGRSGRPLREAWEDDDTKAYLGTVVPDLPAGGARRGRRPGGRGPREHGVDAPGDVDVLPDRRGRVVVNSPWRNVDCRHSTREPNLDDFVVEPRREATVAVG